MRKFRKDIYKFRHTTPASRRVWCFAGAIHVTIVTSRKMSLVAPRLFLTGHPYYNICFFISLFAPTSSPSSSFSTWTTAEAAVHSNNQQHQYLIVFSRLFVCLFNLFYVFSFLSSLSPFVVSDNWTFLLLMNLQINQNMLLLWCGYTIKT